MQFKHITSSSYFLLIAVAFLTMRGTIFLVLLALQFGLQPVFTKENVSPNADKVALVLLCEILKTIVAFLALLGEGDVRAVLSTWSLKDAIMGGAVPAGVYAVQNVFIQIGYQHSSGLMFNLLNQTKIIFTAVAVYLVVGKRQSPMQMVSLLMTLVVGVVLSLPPSDDTGADDETTEFNLWYGVLPTIIAAFLSGVASAWSQKVMSSGGATSKGRSASLFSMELSFFSSIFLFCKMFSATGNIGGVMSRIQILSDANPTLWIHLVTNAVGGLFVGQVIKYAGGVRKSFSIIAGIIITGVAEWFVYSTPLSPRMIVCLPLAVVAMYVYTMYPYVKSKTKDKSV